MMGREACSLSRRDGWGLETEVEGDANVGACQRRLRRPVDRIFGLRAWETGQGGTSSTATSRTNWRAGRVRRGSIKAKEEVQSQSRVRTSGPGVGVGGMRRGRGQGVDDVTARAGQLWRGPGSWTGLGVGVR